MDFVCGGARHILRIRHIRKLSLDFVPLGWLIVFGEHYGTHGACLRSGHVWTSSVLLVRGLALLGKKRESTVGPPHIVLLQRVCRILDCSSKQNAKKHKNS